jgi:hypothetical protein
MAESAAQRNARLRAKRKEAMSRAAGGAREDAAVEKTVAPATPPSAQDDKEYMSNGQSVQDAMYTRHHNSPIKPVKQLVPAKPNQKQPGSNKVYTKHVVFALVSAIVIQLVALNKSLPTKG